MIYLVVLSGGGGLRLWPLSHELFPKQFIKPLNSATLFQETIMRNNFVPIIVTNMNYKHIVKQQLLELGVENYKLILEERKVGTALAIASAASCVQKDDVLLISPSDIFIKNNCEYGEVIDAAINNSVKNKTTTSIVVKSKNGNSPYGYVRLSRAYDIVSFIKDFVEKPNNILDHSDFYWNTGIFVCLASVYLSNLFKYSKLCFMNYSRLMHYSYCDSKNNLYLRCNEECLSVDKAIMEKSKNTSAIVGDFGWLDMGSWQSLYEFASWKDEIIVYEHVYCEQIFMQEVLESKLFVIVMHNKAFLIYDRVFAKANVVVRKLWGIYKVLYENSGMIIKHLILDAGKSISLQRHNYRSETWLIISGNAVVTIGNKVEDGKKGDLFSIPVGCLHQVRNESKVDLHILELQIGNILSEHDVIRFSSKKGSLACYC